MTAFAVGTLDVSSKPPVRRNLWAGDGLIGDRPLGTMKEKVWSQLTEVLCMEIFTSTFLFIFDGHLFACHPCHVISCAVSLMYSLSCTSSSVSMLHLGIHLSAWLVDFCWGGGPLAHFGPSV